MFEQTQAAIDIKLEICFSSIERLMANLFPTISGPCDRRDYSSGVDRTKTGELAIYLYDNVYDGVNLTERAFDRMTDLFMKVHERIESCECSSDSGCVRCIADPLREVPSSKVATLAKVDKLLAIFADDQPPVVDFEFSGELTNEVASVVACPACQATVASIAKFCSNCGTPIEELAHASA